MRKKQSKSVYLRIRKKDRLSLCYDLVGSEAKKVVVGCRPAASRTGFICSVVAFRQREFWRGGCIEANLDLNQSTGFRAITIIIKIHYFSFMKKIHFCVG